MFIFDFPHSVCDGAGVYFFFVFFFSPLLCFGFRCGFRVLARAGQGVNFGRKIFWGTRGRVLLLVGDRMFLGYAIVLMIRVCSVDSSFFASVPPAHFWGFSGKASEIFRVQMALGCFVPPRRNATQPPSQISASCLAGFPSSAQFQCPPPFPPLFCFQFFIISGYNGGYKRARGRSAPNREIATGRGGGDDRNRSPQPSAALFQLGNPQQPPEP
jgi:hypothetical protein